MENYPKEISTRLFSHVAKYYIQYVGDSVEAFRKFECLTSVIPPEPDYWGIIDDADDKIEDLRALYQNMCVFYIADQMISGIQNDPELEKLIEPYQELDKYSKQNKSNNEENYSVVPIQNSEFDFEFEKDFSPFACYVLERFHSLDKQFKNEKPLLPRAWVDVVKMKPPPPSKLSKEEQKIKKQALSTHINKVMSALCLELL